MYKSYYILDERLNLIKPGMINNFTYNFG